jgi:hypothetical protein
MMAEQEAGKPGGQEDRKTTANRKRSFFSGAPGARKETQTLEGEDQA